MSRAAASDHREEVGMSFIKHTIWWIEWHCFGVTKPL